MTDLTLYHNPRCSKSRGALELLEARGLAPTVVRYLETPPSAEELRSLLGKGVAYAPTLATGFEQSLVFGTLEAADTDRESLRISGISFQIRGLPTS